MAFLYLTNGQVLRVPSSREQIAGDLARGAGPVLTYEVDTRSGGAVKTTQVAVVTANIAAVTDEPLG